MMSKNQPDLERRFRRIRVDPITRTYLGGIYEVRANPLPADSQLVEERFDKLEGLWHLTLASGEYEQVPFGRPIPEQPAPVVDPLEW